MTLLVGVAIGEAEQRLGPRGDGVEQRTLVVEHVIAGAERQAGGLCELATDLVRKEGLRPAGPRELALLEAAGEQRAHAACPDAQRVQDLDAAGRGGLAHLQGLQRGEQLRRGGSKSGVLAGQRAQAAERVEDLAQGGRVTALFVIQDGRGAPARGGEQ